MRCVTPQEATVIPAQPHRPGGVAFRHLLAGDDAAPNNYSLSLVDVASHYAAPRHRHNFEQVRLMLDGRFGFGPGACQEPGSLGYFCEGTYYTQQGDGSSTTLLLQCGGASGSGYMGFDRLQQGIQQLSARGDFHDGVFTWHDDQGKKHNQDGYEAVWEHVYGKPVVYPRQRYHAPVIVEPEHFAWLPWIPGAALKRLGSFNERGLGVAYWRIDASVSVRWAAAERTELLYVLSGSVTVPGKTLPQGSAIEVRRGERFRLRAGELGAQLVGFSLPSFDI